MLVRRAVAAGAALVIIVIFAIAVKGCLDSRHKDALRSYNSSVSAIAGESGDQVSKPLFQLLTHSQGKQALDVETQINQYRVLASDEAVKAKNLSVPNEMAGAQRALLLALDLRADAVGKVASNVSSALGTQGTDQAIASIAGEMEVLLASDVIYSQRVVPLISQALADKGIGGQSILASQFVPDLGWLSPQTVSSRLLGGSSGATSGGPIKPGSHGHAVLGASIGTATLQPSPAVNQIKAGPGLTLDAKIANQGSNDETGVQVSVKIEGSGAPVTATKTIDRTKAGTVVDAMIPLTSTPPAGTNAKIVVSVAPVPGEKNLSNNHLTFIAQFN